MSGISKWSRIHLTTGCTPLSAGCDNCNARRKHKMRGAMGLTAFAADFEIAYVDLDGWNRANLSKAKAGALFEISPYSDFFHENIPAADQRDAAERICRAPHLNFMICTKRAERMLRWSEEMQKEGLLPRNLILAVSVEDNANLSRIDILRRAPAAHRAVFFQPLLEEIREPNLDLIDWVLVGGEDAVRAPRPMEPEWAAHLAEWALQKGKAFYFCGWGSVLAGRYVAPPQGKKMHEETGLGLLRDVGAWRPDLRRDADYFWRHEFPPGIGQ